MSSSTERHTQMGSPPPVNSDHRPHPLGRRRTLALLSSPLLFSLSHCSSSNPNVGGGHRLLVVSVADQNMGLFQGGRRLRTYQISTSKFGLGDEPGSYKTPLGRMVIAEKVGQNLPPGAVLKGRRWTGEVLPPNAPGRDPIVSRVLWLRGLEPRNKNAYRRTIYIHGTAEESRIGQAASYGCIRMRSHDVIELFNVVPVGTPVTVITGKLPRSA